MISRDFSRAREFAFAAARRFTCRCSRCSRARNVTDYVASRYETYSPPIIVLRDATPPSICFSLTMTFVRIEIAVLLMPRQRMPSFAASISARLMLCYSTEDDCRCRRRLLLISRHISSTAQVLRIIATERSSVAFQAFSHMRRRRRASVADETLIEPLH